MVTLTNFKIRQTLERLGLPQAEPDWLHILGIRGALPVTDHAGMWAIRFNSNQPNQYNDTLVLFGSEFFLAQASVDPGDAWGRNPSNPTGCAHLVNGAYRYQLGKHKGRDALTQLSPVTVRRDQDRDLKAEKHEPVETGFFGINIHAGGARPAVDEYSAGCQVIFGGWSGQPWKQFMEKINRANQPFYRYYLIDATDLPH